MHNQGEDLINKLPDDIIVSIFSYLNLREAAKTSVLSHRWRNLWASMTSILKFGKSQSKVVSIHTDEEQKSLESEQRKFIELVNMVLRKHKGSTIHEFKVCFNLDKGSSDMINSWIKFGLDRHVKKLTLDVGRIYSMVPRREYFLTTQFLYHSSLGSLTAVYLKNVEVVGTTLQYILSSSPKLQVLHVEKSGSLVKLKIGDPLPNLRCLEIVCCPSFSSLEVHAINIVSFTYHGPECRVFFKKVPDLVEASLWDGVFLFKKIFHSSSCFSRLESLVWHLRLWTGDDLKSVGGFPVLPKFEKLNQLEVSFSRISAKGYVRYCTKLLKASPLLQRFVLKIYEITGRSRRYDGTFEVKRSKYQHNQLKVMEFIGYDGTCHPELGLRLLNKLPSLEKVIVDPKPLYWLGREFQNPQHMQTWLPPGVELVIISHENDDLS